MQYMCSSNSYCSFFFMLNISADHMTFVSLTYTDTRAGVYVCGVVSRPWQRQEIPRDVFNKAGQRQPESWQMKTCWSTPQNSKNTLPALAAKKKKITVRVLVYKNDCMFIVCVRSRERERLWMHFLPSKWWKKRASKACVCLQWSNRTSVQYVYGVSASMLSLYCYHLPLLCHSVQGETVMCSLGLTQNANVIT